MKLFIVAPGHRYLTYGGGMVKDRGAREYRSVGSGYTQKLMVYTESDWAKDVSVTKDGLKRENGRDLYIFKIEPTVFYQDEVAIQVVLLEYAARDVWIVTTEELAEVVERFKGK